MTNGLMVNIVMVTYNQGAYVSMAIESVMAQICNFPVLLIISDDCSTDQTPDICRQYALQYPDKILFLRNEQNLGLVLNYKKAFDACTAKYIAILEGDDYWTDPLKLQKQADLLEAEQEVGLVHGARYTLIEETGKMAPLSPSTIKSDVKNQGYVYEKLIRKNFITPLTVLFRRSLIEGKVDFQFFMDNHFKTIDYALWLTIAVASKIRFMEEVLGVYRVRETSVSNRMSIDSMAEFIKTSRITVKYFLQSHPVVNFDEKEVDAFYDTILFSHSLLSQDRKNAKFYGAKIKSKNVKDTIKILIARSLILTRLYSWILNKLK